MTDTVFREAPPPPVERPPAPEPDVDKTRSLLSDGDNEPVEMFEERGKSVVLEALNINEDPHNLPDKDKDNLGEVKNYVLEIVKQKGLSPTISSFTKTLNGLKVEMGLDEEAEPSIVLDRIGGVIKAWKNLSFITNPADKKRIFMKLANLKSSAEMNREVYRLMSDYKVWR